MSRRYARKVDTTQSAIVDAIRKAGWLVYLIGQPCDIACYKAGVWKLLELKSPRNKAGDPRSDKRQKAQTAFLALTATPVCVTPIAALEALGSVQRQDER